ncbi:hypothetical protein YC2023_120866 [Brassica napus]
MMAITGGSLLYASYSMHYEAITFITYFLKHGYKSLLSLNEESIFENIPLVVVKMNNGTIKMIRKYVNKIREYLDDGVYYAENGQCRCLKIFFLTECHDPTVVVQTETESLATRMLIRRWVMARKRSSVSDARANPHVNSLMASASRTQNRICSCKPFTTRLTRSGCV